MILLLSSSAVPLLQDHERELSKQRGMWRVDLTLYCIVLYQYYSTLLIIRALSIVTCLHVSDIVYCSFVILVYTGAHEQKERATYSANTLIINDVLPLYLGMNVRHIYLTRITW